MKALWDRLDRRGWATTTLLIIGVWVAYGLLYAIGALR